MPVEPSLALPVAGPRTPRAGRSRLGGQLSADALWGALEEVLSTALRLDVDPAEVAGAQDVKAACEELRRAVELQVSSVVPHSAYTSFAFHAHNLPSLGILFVLTVPSGSSPFRLHLRCRPPPASASLCG